MIVAVLTITGFYFIIGAFALTVISRKNNGQKASERWVKYFVYLLIVGAVILTIEYTSALRSFVIVLLLLGAREILVAPGSLKKTNINVLGYGVLIYSAVACGFFYFTETLTPGKILFVYTLVFTFDGFSQIIGQLSGKHALAPKISPNKTVEGTIGGTLFALLTGVILNRWIGLSPVNLVLLSMSICFFALTGDLLASFYKRANSIKDYGTLLPGHGGVLDRFDSFMMAGAAAGILFNI